MLGLIVVVILMGFRRRYADGIGCSSVYSLLRGGEAGADNPSSI